MLQVPWAGSTGKAALVASQSTLRRSGVRDHARWALHHQAVLRHRSYGRTRRNVMETVYARRLTSRERKQIRDYAIDVFGSAGFAAWLEQFTVVRGEFKEGWMPLDHFELIVAPQVNRRLHDVSGAKTLTPYLLDSVRMPDLATLIRGSYFGLDGVPIPVGDVASVLFAHADEVVVKDDGGARSLATTVVSRATFDALDVAQRHPNAALQRRISVHPDLQAVSGGFGTKVRMTTCRASGQMPELRGAYIAFPGHRDPYTIERNASWAAISLETGRTTHAYLNELTRDPFHPTTRVPLEGMHVPGFVEAARMCVDAHRAFPHLGVIGWDVMIDTAQIPWVIEWNVGAPNVHVHEVLEGPSLTGLGWHELRWTPAFA